MSYKQDIVFYLKVLSYLGIFNATYNSEKRLIIMTCRNEKQAFVRLIIVLSVNVLVLVYFILNINEFSIAIHNRTGDIYNILTFVINCLLISAISIYFYVHRQQHSNLLKELLQLNTSSISLKPQSSKNRQLLRMPTIYMLLALLCWINHYRGFRHSGFSGHILIIYTSVFSLSFMYCGLVLMLHIWIQNVLMKAFQCWNTKVLHMDFTRTTYYLELQMILLKRLNLLNTCQTNINSLYGIIIIFIVAFILFTAPTGFFYLISVVLNNNFEDNPNWLSAALTSLFWNFSWLTVLIMMMMGNGVTTVVNDMNRALCKIPRKHYPSSMRKMLEKLLLKSLRQRPVPILTAHGFFALDKGTLFQLFTAILTYMVILVQFKELESSTMQKLCQAPLRTKD